MTGKKKQKSRPTIQKAKRGLSTELLRYPNVSGVGTAVSADGVQQIKVYLSDDAPETLALVPHEGEGYPVVSEVIGPITVRAAAPLDVGSAAKDTLSYGVTTPAPEA